MKFLESLCDHIGAWFATANKYCIPIPLILGMGAHYFFMRRGIKWATRQTHYLDILKNMGIWQTSLSDRLDYY